MNKLLLAMIAALGLAENATEEQAIAALSRHTTNLRNALGLDDKANGDELVAACTGLKAKAAVSNDPSQFVPVSAVAALQADIAALTARLGQRDEQDLESQIAAALEDGRLHTGMEAWARDLGKSNRVALTAYLDAAAPIAALTSSQTRGKPPVTEEKTGLNESELAVCSRLGLTPEQFKAQKPEEQ